MRFVLIERSIDFTFYWGIHEFFWFYAIASISQKFRQLKVAKCWYFINSNLQERYLKKLLKNCLVENHGEHRFTSFSSTLRKHVLLLEFLKILEVIGLGICVLLKNMLNFEPNRIFIKSGFPESALKFSRFTLQKKSWKIRFLRKAFSERARTNGWLLCYERYRNMWGREVSQISTILHKLM